MIIELYLILNISTQFYNFRLIIKVGPDVQNRLKLEYKATQFPKIDYLGIYEIPRMFSISKPITYLSSREG